MPALITLTADQQEQLKGLLNGLNRRLGHANFGDVFVSWLNGDKVELTVHEQDVLRALLNRLNLKARKMRFGDLAIGLLDDATKKATIDALSAADIDQIRGLLNNLNLDIQEIELGKILGDIVAPPAATTPPNPGTGTGGTGGTTTKLTPAIDTQPAAASVTEPATASFTVVANNGKAGDKTGLTYKWQIQKGTGAWGDVTGGTGGDAATFTTAATAIADNGNKYKVIVTNADGNTVESTPVALTVAASTPAVTITPKTAPADFRVGGTDLEASDLFTIDPAGTAFTIATDKDDFAKIVSKKLRPVAPGTVKVTATAGSVTATLDVVVKPAALSVAVTPAAAQDKNEGDALDTLTAAATGGDGTYTYQWQLAGADVTGETGATLDIASLAAADAGDYTVVVTDGAAATATSNAVTVTVTAP